MCKGKPRAVLKTGGIGGLSEPDDSHMFTYYDHSCI
jgi:hypothetical protein